jgi:hypothetical protein
MVLAAQKGVNFQASSFAHAVLVAGDLGGRYDDRTMKGQAPRAVGDLLPAAMPQLGERLLEYRVQASWTSIVGRDVARRARPSSYASGTLQVVVDNSPWLHELTLRVADLQRMVSAHFPEVRALRFSLATSPIDPPSRDRVSPARSSTVALGRDDVADIDAAVSAIADPEVAEAARRLLTTARRTPIPGAPR